MKTLTTNFIPISLLFQDIFLILTLASELTTQSQEFSSHYCLCALAIAMAPSKSREKLRLSHEECRRWTCFSCRRKATKHPINDAGKELVSKVLCRNVPWDDPCIPCGLCPTCLELLDRWDKWDPNCPDDKPPAMPVVADFREVVIFPP